MAMLKRKIFDVEHDGTLSLSKLGRATLKSLKLKKLQVFFHNTLFEKRIGAPRHERMSLCSLCFSMFSSCVEVETF